MGKQALLAAGALAAASMGNFAAIASASDHDMTVGQAVTECEADSTACRDFLFEAHRYVHTTLVAFDRNHPLTRCVPRKAAGEARRASDDILYRFLRERLVVWLKASGDMDALAYGIFARMMRRRTSRILTLCRR